MATGDGPPLSLRPFPVADRKPKNVADFIPRVNAQAGGFRVVTEDRLREEISASEEARDENGGRDLAMSDAEEDDGGDDAATDPNQARTEVLKNIDIAGNTAMLTLDSLSLLLSKQNPTQAGLTLSQQLRDMVGIGTIGADKLDDTNITPAKAKDDENVAMGWTLMEVNKTRDAAEEASQFLRREVEAESIYWDDVVKVHQAGWSICKVPQERHTLGVRFGFSEATPEFKNNGLAPMRRGDDGTVQLDCGKLGGVSERLLVTYEKNGEVVGRSPLPAQTKDDASLQARVLEARNTIFAQELWFELSRESRSLFAYGVRTDGARLICEVGESSRIILELVPLEQTPLSNDSFPENIISEAISATLHILLSYAHRYNELMRIRPLPPHIRRVRGQQPYALFKPIIARTLHMRSVQSCTEYVAELVAALKKAGFPASFALQTQQPSVSDSNIRGSNKPSAAQVLVGNMLQPLEFNVRVTVLEDTSFTVRARTFLYPVTTTHYNVVAPPSAPLHRICPPFKEGFADIAALSHYLRTAVARILTEHVFAKLLSSPSRTVDWIQSISGTAICYPDRDDFEVRFGVAGGRPAVAVECDSNDENNQSSTKTFSWASDSADEKTLENVVSELMDQSLS